MPYVSVFQKRQMQATASGSSSAPSRAGPSSEGAGPTAKKSLMQMVAEAKLKEEMGGSRDPFASLSAASGKPSGTNTSGTTAAKKAELRQRSTGWPLPPYCTDGSIPVAFFEHFRQRSDILLLNPSSAQAFGGGSSSGNNRGTALLASLPVLLRVEDLQVPFPIRSLVHDQLGFRTLHPLQASGAPSMLLGRDTVVFGSAGTGRRSIALVASFAMMLCDTGVVAVRRDPPQQQQSSSGTPQTPETEAKEFLSYSLLPLKQPYILYVTSSLEQEHQVKGTILNYLRDIDATAGLRLTLSNDINPNQPAHVVVINANKLKRGLESATASGARSDYVRQIRGARLLVADEFDKYCSKRYEDIWEIFRGTDSDDSMFVQPEEEEPAHPQGQGQTPKADLIPQLIGIGTYPDLLDGGFVQRFLSDADFVIHHTSPETISEHVIHTVEYVADDEKPIQLLACLHRLPPPAVVAVNSRDQLELVCSFLKAHGITTDTDPLRLLKNFDNGDQQRGPAHADRRGGEPALVAVVQDSQLIGLKFDVSAVRFRHVINYDVPFRHLRYSLLNRMSVFHRDEPLGGSSSATAEEEAIQKEPYLCLMSSFVNTTSLKEGAAWQLKELLELCGHSVPHVLKEVRPPISRGPRNQ